MKIRLQKYMADQGIASRRKSEEMIAAGMVKVNGEVVTEMGLKVDPENDTVEVDGAMLQAEREKLRYIKLYKPKGYECSTNPPEGVKSVYELVDASERLFTVGRLDKDSEGLILLTNDGRITQQLTHPSFENEKEYEVTVHRPLSEDGLDRLRGGINMLGGKTKEVNIIPIASRKFRVVLREGKNRQIRRMCRTIGLRVHKLKRIRVGTIELDNLEIGQWKDLDARDMKYIESILSS